MRIGWTAAVAAFALGATACGGDSASDVGTTAAETTTVAVLPEVQGEPPTAESLAGTWSRVGEAATVEFTADGEFRMARNEADLLDSPYAFGTYEVEGDSITLAGGCATVWQAGLDEDELEVVVVVAGCDLPSRVRLNFVRISPR